MHNRERVKLSVFRHDPDREEAPRYENYRIPYMRGMTVLGVLKYVSKHLDGSLAFHYECRNGYCGTCAVLVNKSPVLACKTMASKKMTVEPLPNFPIVRDLTIDRSLFDERINRVRPFIERATPHGLEPEELRPKDFKTYKTVSRCITCLSCQSSCPVVAEGKRGYAGPAVMIELARFAFDPRDSGARSITAYHEGILQCTSCSKCKRICPSNIPIPGIIKKMQERATRAVSTLMRQRI